MIKETRTAVFDEALRIEAYHFEGFVKPFPNHFHDHYVIGIVENGTRELSCNNLRHTLFAGDMLLLCPGDSHGCVQTDGGTLDYRALNIPKDIMSELSREITGNSAPRFSRNVLSDAIPINNNAAVKSLDRRENVMIKPRDIRPFFPLAPRKRIPYSSQAPQRVQ